MSRPAEGTATGAGALLSRAPIVSTSIGRLSSRQPAWPGETGLAEHWTEAVSGW